MSDKRFYLSHYADQPDRPVLFADVGNLLKISGVLYQGMGSNLLLLSPSAESVPTMLLTEQPSVEEWSEIIRQSDDPEMFVGEVGGINKVLHRKQRFEISGHVQQKIWARDGFACVYCGAEMGKAQLTIDHVVSLEMGGENHTKNYVSCCRRDNKRKGSMSLEDFCSKHNYDFERISRYVAILQ